MKNSCPIRNDLMHDSVLQGQIHSVYSIQQLEVVICSWPGNNRDDKAQLLCRLQTATVKSRGTDSNHLAARCVQ